MSEKQETIADIVAEKRERADEIERDVAAKMASGEMVSDQYAREVIADLRMEADRIEAAAKRDRGNVEEMRKTLERLLFVIIGGGLKRDRSYKQATGKDLAVELIAQIKSALATEKEGGAA